LKKGIKVPKNKPKRGVRKGRGNKDDDLPGKLRKKRNQQKHRIAAGAIEEKLKKRGRRKEGKKQEKKGYRQKRPREFLPLGCREKKIQRENRSGWKHISGGN